MATTTLNIVKDELDFTVGTEKFVFNGTDFFIAGKKGTPLTPEQLNTAVDGFTKAVKEFVVSKPVEEELFPLLNDAASVLHAQTPTNAGWKFLESVAESKEKIKAALDKAPATGKLDKTIVDEITAALKENKAAMNMLTNEHYRILHDPKRIDSAAVLAEVARHHEGIEALDALRTKFRDGTKVTADEVKAVLKRHGYGIVDHLQQTPDGKELLADFTNVKTPKVGHVNEAINVREIADQVKVDVEDHVGKMKKLAQEYITAQRDYESATIKYGSSKRLSAAAEKFNKAFGEAEVADLRHYVDAEFRTVFSDADRKILSESKDIGSAIGQISAAGKSTTATEKSGTFFKDLMNFKHTEASLKIPEARTAGKTAEEIGKLEKAVGTTRWGKVAAAGAIGAGALYLVKQALTAGTGNAGPGERAREVREQRDMAPDLATGRA